MARQRAGSRVPAAPAGGALIHELCRSLPWARNKVPRVTTMKIATATATTLTTVTTPTATIATLTQRVRVPAAAAEAASVLPEAPLRKGRRRLREVQLLRQRKLGGVQLNALLLVPNLCLQVISPRLLPPCTRSPKRRSPRRPASFRVLLLQPGQEFCSAALGLSLGCSNLGQTWGGDLWRSPVAEIPQTSLAVRSRDAASGE